MESDSQYKILYYSGFNHSFKKLSKKYKHSFDKDFNLLTEVIVGKLPLSDENPRNLPNADVIPGIGNDACLPIVKIRMLIKEAKKMIGRAIPYLFFLRYSRHSSSNLSVT